MMKKHISSWDETHKNITRLEYLRTLHPSIAAKLKWILDECREKGKNK